MVKGFSEDILQKKATRAVNNLDFNVHTSESYLNMKTMKLEDLHKFKISVMMHYDVNQRCYDYVIQTTYFEFQWL